MICKIVINRIIALIFLSVISTANAGLISTANGYIDDNTGLEWMDFSGTADLSYSYVITELSEGGLFQDWVRPTEGQVQALYNGNFGSSTWDAISGNSFADNDDCIIFYLPCESAFDALWEIMGEAPLWGPDYLGFDYKKSYFMFQNDEGRLMYNRHWDFVGEYERDFLSVNQNETLNDPSITIDTAEDYVSTMLIKKSEITDVPEPSTLAILALGMIGLASRRFKKQS